MAFYDQTTRTPLRTSMRTWVPDYSLDQEVAPAQLIPIENRITYYFASGHKHSSLPLNFGDIKTSTSNLLHVSGVYIEKVERINHSTQYQHFDFIEIHGVDSSYELETIKTP
jgi:hypothetical protein